LLEARQVLRLAHHDDLPQARNAGSGLPREAKQRRRDEQNLGARVLEDVAILLGGQQRVERNRNDAGADRAPEQHREVDRIEHHHGDAVFAGKAEPGQHRRDARAAFGKLAIGHAPRRIDEGSLRAAPLGDVAVDHIDGGIIHALRAHDSGVPLSTSTLLDRHYISCGARNNRMFVRKIMRRATAAAEIPYSRGEIAELQKNGATAGIAPLATTIRSITTARERVPSKTEGLFSDANPGEETP
jgi:hypothetical protein